MLIVPYRKTKLVPVETLARESGTRATMLAQGEGHCIKTNLAREEKDSHPIKPLNTMKEPAIIFLWSIVSFLLYHLVTKYKYVVCNLRLFFLNVVIIYV